MKFLHILSFILSACIFYSILTFSRTVRHAVVLTTDFGTGDGAVSAMKGVIYSVNKGIIISDLTHEISPFNITEAAYRLYQVAQYWPVGTVFVNVIDPGVGTTRKSIVLKTKSGHYFVSPDNGTLTLVADHLGIDQVWEIDEKKNRLSGSDESYTFYGRDLYAYVGAKLAAGMTTLGTKLGKRIDNTALVRINLPQPIIENNTLVGSIPVLDVRYGNVWTNIDSKLVKHYNLQPGNTYHVSIFNGSAKVYDSEVVFEHVFGNVPNGQPLLYLNSLLNLSVAINQGDFAATHHIDAGGDWKVIISATR
jgi:S-adenosylmethionine hydrolase